MSATINMNPMATTNANGLFNVNSAGFTQGDAQDDPAVKFQLASGILSTSATAPLWGGIPISESIPAAVTQPGTNLLGSSIIQATTLANSTGICVFNQAFHGITSPQSNAPSYLPGMSVNFYRFGSGARIPLQIDPALVSLDGGLINQLVTWDYTNNKIIAYDSSHAFPVKILSIATTGNKTVSYDSATGYAIWVTTGAIALCVI
jgi:hypothetical protein